MNCLEIRTTFSGREDAEKIARDVVEKRLAACAQVSHIRSFFRWKGIVEDEDEFLISMKTSSDRVDELVEYIKKKLLLLKKLS